MTAIYRVPFIEYNRQSLIPKLPSISCEAPLILGKSGILQIAVLSYVLTIDIYPPDQQESRMSF